MAIEYRYGQHLCAIGSPGTGKTVWLQWFARQVPRVLCWDLEGRDGWEHVRPGYLTQDPRMARQLLDADPAAPIWITLRVPDTARSPREIMAHWETTLATLWGTAGPLLVVCDEAAQALGMSPWQTPPETSAWLVRARKRGWGLALASQRSQLLPKTALANSNWLAVLGLSSYDLAQYREWLRDPDLAALVDRARYEWYLQGETADEPSLWGAVPLTRDPAIRPQIC